MPWLVTLNAMVFAVQEARLAEVSVVDRAVPTGTAIDDGEIWRPLTSLVVHPGGLIHLSIDALLLAVVGPHAERELGRGRFIAAYVGAGFATNAARYALGGVLGSATGDDAGDRLFARVVAAVVSAGIFAMSARSLASWQLRPPG